MPAKKKDRTLVDLVGQLSDEDPLVRYRASVVFGSMGEAAASAVSDMARLLQEGDLPTRRVVALTLGEIGPAAEAAREALATAATDEDEIVAERGRWALEMFKGPTTSAAA